jgi:Kef-type K+ transport system membrane component KefB
MSFSGLSRVLLSSGGDTHDDDSSTSCGYDPYAALVSSASHDDSHSSHDAFDHLYHTMAFVAILWFAGKLAVKFGMPALVGEIVFGIILGPHLVNLPGDEGSDFLIVIGEIGLVMLVVEAGIDVDIGMLKLIGPRGVCIAILGSIFPMSMGFCISYLTMGTDVMTSIAVGACFAPTSMGIALNVLKKAKLLNTPTGQLIIAAAILDDVLALIILSELSAMADPTVVGILMPLIVSPVLIVIIGYLALRWIPHWIKLLMTKVKEEYRENVILGILFATTFAFIPMCH